MKKKTRPKRVKNVVDPFQMNLRRYLDMHIQLQEEWPKLVLT
jgi:hypothetical protein